MVIKRVGLKDLIFNLSVFGSILSLSTTKLRLNEDIGLGELFIVASLMLFLLNIRSLCSNVGKKSLPIWFISSFIITNLLGFLYSIFFIDQLYNNDFLFGVVRTSSAYLLCLANGIQLAALIENKNDFEFFFKKILFYFNIVTLISFILLMPNLLAALGGGARFSGFSKNPNQLGTITAVAPFIAFYLYKVKRIKLFTLLFTLLVVALLAKVISSDAVYYSLILCGFIYLFLTFKNYNIQLKFFLIMLFALIFYNLVLSNLEHYIIETNDDGDQATVRYILWGNALISLLSSPIVGFGPGAYSGLTGPFQGAESHNIIIDYLTNTGIIGLIFLFVFLYKILYKLYQSKEHFILLSLISLLTFGLFHNILRHPIFWALLFVIYSYNNLSFKKRWS